MLFLVCQGLNAQDLRHIIQTVAEPYQFVVLGDGGVFGINDALYDRFDIGRVVSWLQRRLCCMKLSAAGDTSTQGLDPSRKRLRVSQLCLNIRLQSFFDFFCTNNLGWRRSNNKSLFFW